MLVNWEVEDGYIGKSRPQHTAVPDDELAECESREAKMKLIYDYIDEDFAQKITYGITGDIVFEETDNV